MCPTARVHDHIPVFGIHIFPHIDCFAARPPLQGEGPRLALGMGRDQRGQGALDVALAVAVDHEHLHIRMTGEIQHLF